MQEAEEQDTCRICSAPAEPGQPLFYPCKCSGTIRYIHQDCLTTWLAHSKKKNCDVCKHPYSFTKVYATDMPTRLPPALLIRRLAQQSLFAILFGIRAIAVGIIWLAVLPWVTVWTWRMYFSMGDSTAWWISDRPRPTPGADSSPFYYHVPADASTVPQAFLARISAHPVWLALSADIFTGQIIASLIVLTFVAVFLLREWISQNARPGVFEDEEILPEEREGQQHDPPPVEEGPLPNALELDQNQPPRVQHTQRQLDAVNAVDAIMVMEGTHGHVVGDEGHGRRPRQYARKGKARQGDDLDRYETDLRVPARARRRLQKTDLGDMDDYDRSRRRSFSRRLHAARISGARRRAEVAAATSSASLQAKASENDFSMKPEPEKFQFTFRVPQSQMERRNFVEPRVTRFSSSAIDNTAATVTAPIFPPVQLLPPVELPYSLRKPVNRQQQQDDPDTSPPPSSSPALVLPEQTKMAPLRRPPLPTTLPPSDGIGLPSPPLSAFSPGTSRFGSATQKPLESPSLATYRAPEELEAGPSRLAGYFDEDEGVIDTDVGLSPEEMEEEHGRYFREADDAESEASQDEGEGDLSTMGRLKEMSEVVQAEDGEEEAPIGEGVEGAEEEEEEEYGDEEEEGEYGDDDDEEEEEEGEEEGNPFILIRDAQWDEGIEPEDDEEDVVGADVGIGVGAVAAAGVGGGPGAAAGQPQQGLPEAVAQADANDDPEGNVDDDMEGAMEAIGMRGPIYGVVQNAALMIFVLDTAIGLGIWIPFTIGKSTALLSLDPHRFLQILHLPIRAMRIVTDPVVDSVAYIVVEFVLPPFLRLARKFSRISLLGGLFLARKVFGQDRANKVSEVATMTYLRVSNFLDRPLSLVSWSLSSSQVRPALETSPVVDAAPSGVTSAFPSIVSTAEPYFAVLGKEVRLSAVHLQTTWKRMALGQGPSERAFAVILGYAVVGVLLSLYLNILTVGNVKSAGRAVRSAVRQQLLVLKVATFIFIELVTFPLGCGIVLDLCTVWLFPEASLLSRAVFFFQAPLTAMFYHWVAGTMFMYSFAILLSGCRSIMRPGAMWFIKDPQDQNSHPIRDILDRPTLTQLRKICVSGLMYSFVVACVVGSVAGLLLLGSKSIMPFRWKNREPLSNVPIDLLFLHLVLPYTMHYFRPRKALKKLATILWKFLATRLRLTSYFFGGRNPSEEYTPVHWKTNLFNPNTEAANLESVRNGTFRRVPATDNIALPRDMRATAAVTEDGEPVDDTARQLIANQNAEAEKAKRVVKDDYTVVYFPPHFRYRVFFFITLLWIIGAIFLGFMFALPIQLGRSFFKLFISHDVHDGYSFIVGCYLLWGCYIVGKAIDRLDKRRQRRGVDGPRADLRILVIKRGLLWVAKISYMIFFLGVVIPTLISFVVDLYIVLPIRFILDPELTPRVRVVDTWALGLIYAKIALHAHHLRPPTRITRGLHHITNNGWTHPDPVTATMEVIGPLTGGLIGMILLPAAIFRTMQYFFPSLPLDNKFIFMHVYPGIFAVAGLVRSAVVLFDLLSSWSQSIRDKEFLVEMRLRNHEPEHPKEGSDKKAKMESVEAEHSDN